MARMQCARILVSCYVIPLLVLSACNHRARLLKKTVVIPSTCSQQELSEKIVSSDHIPCITVWIHGTKFMRSDTFKYVYNGIPDLKHIAEFPSAHKIQLNMRTLDRDAPELFAYDSLYLFGWSGKLSVRERYWAALILYQKLCALTDSYKESYGVQPRIRLVTHSHGGNIALNLARIHKIRKGDLSIDTLVLLACPVQNETKSLVMDCLFEHIYAFYSALDIVQLLAPEFKYNVRACDDSIIRSGLRWLPMSERNFSPDTPVRQAWIKQNNHAVMHTTFTTTQFLRTLPALLKAIDEIYRECKQEILEGKEALLHIISRGSACRSFWGERCL